MVIKAAFILVINCQKMYEYDSHTALDTEIKSYQFKSSQIAK